MSQTSSDRTNGRSETEPLAESVRHRLLSCERRRILLDVLEESQTPIGLGSISAAVEERERNADPIDPEKDDRVAIALHHVHLPMLAEAGVVDYDATSNRVESFRDRLHD